MVDPGAFLCFRSSLPDASFRKLGLGLCLYFKFIKHASIALLAVSLLALLACSLCVVVGVGNGFNPSLGYNSFFFSTAIGTFSSEHFKCEYAVVSAAGQASFDLTCPHGQVGLFGAVFSNQSKSSLFNCRNEIEKYQTSNPTFATGSYLTSNSPSCNADRSQCQFTLGFTSNRPTFIAVAYAYQCENNEYGVAGSTIPS